jgi:hypothetical protein
MPDIVSFDLRTLIRVCLNDPDLRAEVFSAIDQGPIPVRTTCAHVVEGEQTYQAMVRTDRNKQPGDSGFIVRDGLGWISGRLTEVIKTEHDASTVSAEEMAKRLGTTLSPEDLAKALNKK